MMHNLDFALRSQICMLATILSGAIMLKCTDQCELCFILLNRSRTISDVRDRQPIVRK